MDVCIFRERNLPGKLTHKMHLFPIDEELLDNLFCYHSYDSADEPLAAQVFLWALRDCRGVPRYEDREGTIPKMFAGDKAKKRKIYGNDTFLIGLGDLAPNLLFFPKYVGSHTEDTYIKQRNDIICANPNVIFSAIVRLIKASGEIDRYPLLQRRIEDGRRCKIEIPFGDIMNLYL